jgi:hypothetical protein
MCKEGCGKQYYMKIQLEEKKKGVKMQDEQN